MNIPLKIVIWLVGAFIASWDLKAQAWEIEEVGPGVKPSIALDRQGRPHVAYSRESSEVMVMHARRSGNSFIISEVAKGYYYAPTEIVMDQQGQPHIIFHNHIDEDLNHYTRTSSGPWVKGRIPHPGHDGWDGDIAIDSGGQLHTSSVDPSFSETSGGAEYGFFDGSTWQVEKIGSTTIQYGNGTSIALDGLDRPHITYYNDQTRDLKYAEKNTVSWKIETVDQAGDVGRFSSLVLDAGGQAHMAYYQHLEEGIGLIKYAEKKGASWFVSSIDTLKDVVLAEASNMISLAIDSQGKLHVAYGDQKVVRYAKKNGFIWDIHTVMDGSGTAKIFGQQHSLLVDDQMIPHLVYYEVTSKVPFDGLIKYAYWKEAVITGVEGVAAGEPQKLSLFPNPARNQLHIKYELFGHQIGKIMILDITGKLWEAFLVDSNSKQITISYLAFPPGVYLVSLYTEKDKVTKKLILL